MSGQECQPKDNFPHIVDRVKFLLIYLFLLGGLWSVLLGTGPPINKVYIK